MTRSAWPTTTTARTSVVSSSGTEPVTNMGVMADHQRKSSNESFHGGSSPVSASGGEVMTICATLVTSITSRSPVVNGCRRSHAATIAAMPRILPSGDSEVDAGGAVDMSSLSQEDLSASFAPRRRPEP
ncbi:hypothetical protein [Microbacterium sp. SORGH_AS_0862]|uniref:hypothetical protein n=1 Tax=Microbacterium sp. SORGH_AS_0862 TaxID=3041789 RepID=UPI002790CCC3|nr:hypothetical protein [Microbacterium sp. SORGH_AS_0862]MDQ1204993.1 hypothetical protein [Microbacterium sp. SORGH_AS_0862]